MAETVERNVTEQLVCIYTDLIRNATKLDPEARDLLYENLWDLYDYAVDHGQYTPSHEQQNEPSGTTEESRDDE